MYQENYHENMNLSNQPQDFTTFGQVMNLNQIVKSRDLPPKTLSPDGVNVDDSREEEYDEENNSNTHHELEPIFQHSTLSNNMFSTKKRYAHPGDRHKENILSIACKQDLIKEKHKKQAKSKPKEKLSQKEKCQKNLDALNHLLKKRNKDY